MKSKPVIQVPEAGRNGWRDFAHRVEAERFRDRILQDFPVEGYGTALSVEHLAADVYRVCWNIGRAD